MTDPMQRYCADCGQLLPPHTPGRGTPSPRCARCRVARKRRQRKESLRRWAWRIVEQETEP